jgi:flavodoxin, short chain
MSKVMVIYWSGTGNTESMANFIVKGIQEAGAEAIITEVSFASIDDLKDVTSFALGCPSMGDESLEEDLMEPFVAEVETIARGKNIGLFGSYGWGNCEWMRDFEERIKNAGANIVLDEGITVLGEPDLETEEKCIELGKALAGL